MTTQTSPEIKIDSLQSMAEVIRSIDAFGHRPGEITRIQVTQVPDNPNRIQLQGRTADVFTAPCQPAANLDPGNLDRAWNRLAQDRFRHHPALSVSIESDGNVTPGETKFHKPRVHLETKWQDDQGQPARTRSQDQPPCCQPGQVAIEGIIFEMNWPRHRVLYFATLPKTERGNAYWQPAQQVTVTNCAQFERKDLAGATIKGYAINLETNHPAVAGLRERLQKQARGAIRMGIAPEPTEHQVWQTACPGHHIWQTDPEHIILTPRARPVAVDPEDSDITQQHSLIRALYRQSQPLVPVEEIMFPEYQEQHLQPWREDQEQPEDRASQANWDTELIDRISLQYREFPDTPPEKMLRPARDITMTLQLRPSRESDAAPQQRTIHKADLAAAGDMPSLGAVYDPDQFDRDQIAQFLETVNCAELEQDDPNYEELLQTMHHEIEERLTADLESRTAANAASLQRQLDQIKVSTPDTENAVTVTREGRNPRRETGKESRWRLTLTYEPIDRE